MENDALGIAVELCKRFEGLYLKPYLCPRGIPTIGYGATFYEDGTRVALLDAPITRERAESLLRWHLSKYFAPQVNKICPTLDTPERIAAILDFTFNLGVGNLKSSTLRRRISESAWDSVRSELLKWNKSGGKVLRGLTLRRISESKLV